MPESERLKPIFVDENDDPIGFFFHKSVQEEERKKVSAAIEKYGGMVLDTDHDADTVLVDLQYAHLGHLQDAYHVHSDQRRHGIRVEATKFVHDCIKFGIFEHTKVKHYPMRGNHPGRMQYTREDDENLCRYLAIKIPDPAAGGRLGHAIYERLVELAYVLPNEFKWAARHPPESWRERYRKNKDRLDVTIRRFVLTEKPTDNQRFPFDRRLNRVHRPVPESEEIGQQVNVYDDYWQDRNRRMAHKHLSSRGRLRVALRQEEEEGSGADSQGEPGHKGSFLFSEEPEFEEVGTPYQAADSSPGRRRSLNEPDASQATLVGRGVAYKTPSQTMRTSGGVPHFRQSTPDHDDHDESPERQRWTRSPDATAVTERAESPQRPLPPVELAPDPVPTRRPRRHAQEPVEVPTPDGPYRRTRARSRSVDPPPLPKTKRQQRSVALKSSTLPTKPVKPRRGLALEGKLQQEPIAEEEEGEGAAAKRRQAKKRRQAEAEDSAEGREQELVSNNEEADVERLLTMEANGSSKSAAAQQHHQQPHNLPHPFPASSSDGSSGPPRRSRRSHRMIDTDDEQIDRELHSNAPNPLDLIREFHAESELHHVPTPASLRSRALQPLLLPKIKQEGRTDTDELYVPAPTTRAAKFRGNVGSN